MPFHFRSTTARKYRNERQRTAEVVLGEKLGSRNRRCNIAYQRVPDELHRHTCIAEEFLLERKNTKCQREAASHNAHSPRPPCPELRTDVIHIPHGKWLQLAGEP